MDPIQPKFLHTAFDIEYQGDTLPLRGLISLAGVTKIFLRAGLPETWKRAVGQTVIVQLGKLKIPGVLLEQEVEHRALYEIKFRELPESMRSHLESRLQAEGITPGWQRQHPRIPVKGYEDAELPVPHLCLVRLAGQEILVKVMNFTVGGIRIETLGDTLREIRVGSHLHFDLMTSRGETLFDFKAEVRNIATHEHQGGQGPSLTRSFGLMFLEIDPVSDKKYRMLIRDYCIILQKRLGDKEDNNE